MSGLETQFHRAMIGIYERAKEECGYNATRFLGMLSEKGGLRTAQILLATSQPSDGYVALWECNRLDLTVEALVLKPEFASLFTEEEKQVARNRLEEYGHKFE